MRVFFWETLYFFFLMLNNIGWLYSGKFYSMTPKEGGGDEKRKRILIHPRNAPDIQRTVSGVSSSFLDIKLHFLIYTGQNYTCERDYITTSTEGPTPWALDHHHQNPGVRLPIQQAGMQVSKDIR